MSDQDLRWRHWSCELRAERLPTSRVPHDMAEPHTAHAPRTAVGVLSRPSSKLLHPQQYITFYYERFTHKNTYFLHLAFLFEQYFMEIPLKTVALVFIHFLNSYQLFFHEEKIKSVQPLFLMHIHFLLSLSPFFFWGLGIFAIIF